SGDALPPLPPSSDSAPAPAQSAAPPTASAQPKSTDQPDAEIAPPDQPPPQTVVVVPPPTQYRQEGDGSPGEETSPKHAPKFSLYTGLNIGVIGFGGSFFQNALNVPESTGNFVHSGLSFELLVGARLGRRYIPYLSWEHGFLGQGARIDGTNAHASSDFIGLGFRLLSFDVDSVAFASDIGIGFRSVTVADDNNTFKMTALEIGRFGLGAEIRLSTLFTLTPMARLSIGQMSDSSGNIAYGAGQGDGQKAVTFFNGQINASPTDYVVVGLGCGGQFDFFGK
ncbi:MAG: hypothetical protein ABI461_14060, partial [Polyangiaceae bacterium]